MSANTTAERTTGSDIEMREVEGHGALNDPTGLYASGRSRIS
jgi:hypothetical protein